MTANEKKALIVYLDDQLKTLCSQIEKHLDPDAVGMLYDKTYDLLHDLEHTLSAQIEMSQANYIAALKAKNK